jgi:hypothetical protein
MSGQHTPGPWVYSPGHLPRVTPRGGKVTICGVHRIGARIGTGHPAETEANGQLIAAAPDLLAASARALAVIEDMEKLGGGKSSVGDALRAAIAKATGA